jgi:lipid-A-disaccharide synthase
MEQLAKEHPDLQFRVSVAQPKFIPLLERMSKEKLIFMDKNRELMQNASFAIAKSGTVTLELALHEVPTVVTYGVSALDVLIAKYLFRIRLPFYCLVNIIAGKEVFPELIGPALTEKNLYDAVKKFLSDPKALEECRNECQKIRHILGDQDAAKRASELILTLL